MSLIDDLKVFGVTEKEITNLKDKKKPITIVIEDCTGEVHARIHKATAKFYGASVVISASKIEFKGEDGVHNWVKEELQKKFNGEKE